MKICKKCLVNKLRTDFYKDKTRLDGLHIWCRVCKDNYTFNWKQTASREELEKHKGRINKWRKDNPERKRVTDLLWREKNKEYTKQLGKRWREQNYEYCKLQRKQNAGIINARNILRRAQKIKATPGWFEKDQVEIVYQKAIKYNETLNCSLEVDHIIPLNSKTVCGLPCWDNLQLLDKSLNSSKHNIYQQDW